MTAQQCGGFTNSFQGDAHVRNDTGSVTAQAVGGVH
jgi:hypothetical protein